MTATETTWTTSEPHALDTIRRRLPRQLRCEDDVLLSDIPPILDSALRQMVEKREIELRWIPDPDDPGRWVAVVRFRSVWHP